MGTVLFLVGALGCALLSVVLVRKRWRFTDTPTSDAAHVFPGLTEVHGTVEAIGQAAKAASDGAPCVWWEYKVERQERTQKNQVRWVTEEHGVTALPFWVRDQSGTVRVVLDADTGVSGAETNDIEHLSLDFLRPYARVMKDTYSPGATIKLLSGLFGSNDRNEPISAFGGTWRAKERRLKVGDRVFLSAHARLTPEGDQVELARTDSQGKRCLFELSVGDEKAAMANFASVPAIAGLALAALVLAGIGGNGVAGSGGTIALLLVLLASAGALWPIGAWNRVRRSRERCLFAWSLIDVACEQRSNLVPQLQAVVGAAFEHERSLLDTVASARSLGRRPSPSLADTVKLADAAAGEVVARVEATPSLNTNPNVAQLMSQVTLLNDRVAFGRRFYNDSVLRLANRLGEFPDSTIARLARVTPLPYIGDELLG